MRGAGSVSALDLKLKGWGGGVGEGGGPVSALDVKPVLEGGMGRVCVGVRP